MVSSISSKYILIIYQIYEAEFITNHLTLTSCGKVYGASWKAYMIMHMHWLTESYNWKLPQVLFFTRYFSLSVTGICHYIENYAFETCILLTINITKYPFNILQKASDLLSVLIIKFSKQHTMI